MRVTAQQLAELKVIDRIVIRRDEQPRTRLELLPVHLPAGAQES